MLSIKRHIKKDYLHKILQLILITINKHKSQDFYYSILMILKQYLYFNNSIDSILLKIDLKKFDFIAYIDEMILNLNGKQICLDHQFYYTVLTRNFIILERVDNNIDEFDLLNERLTSCLKQLFAGISCRECRSLQKDVNILLKEKRFINGTFDSTINTSKRNMTVLI